ncbi:NmrA family transcriptional regulator [Ideonella sp.]|uniref:NmrA family transcriptional regulator n=1 Tax=Ideonella sp. TaxID=1929293 RepID=UPI0035AF3389
MHIVMGVTGHVGASVANALRALGQPVLGLSHRSAPGGSGRAHADVRSVESLRSAFRLGQRAFLLNPPGDVRLDSDRIERDSVRNILEALDGSGLEKVVAASTGGAQPGDHLGDLNVLWELEQGLASQAVPAAINRGAYYYSNWDDQIASARETGQLLSVFPADLPIPMVAPHDLGIAAAQRLVSGLDDVGIVSVEGPARLTSAEVAQCFEEVLGRRVRLEVTPSQRLEATFESIGFSAAAARSYARMTRTMIEQGFDAPDDPWRGSTTFDAYLRAQAAMAGR